MYYSVQHVTRFKYLQPVSESVMEVRMQPRADAAQQRCLKFDLRINPRAQVNHYRDFYGNIVHHFDIPRSHAQLTITAKAVIEMSEFEDVPQRLDGAASWDAVDRLAGEGDHYFELMPSRFTTPTELLEDLARKLNTDRRRDDPLGMLRELNAAIYDHFDYVPESTHVDSPIDDALRSGQGVCQDYSHIMIALVREHLRIPARYVSGYLYHGAGDKDRSTPGATHAWMEALLPELGWVGFDPTNDLLAGERHIRVAVGRDYGDVPPTHGIYKGKTETELQVSVEVKPCEAPVVDEPLERVAMSQAPPDQLSHHQQQQQQ